MSSLSATFLKCAAISLSFSRSMPVSRLVPLSVATSDSVAGWEVPFASGDSAQSTMSTPAWAAIRFVMSPVPVVLCVCRWIGHADVRLELLDERIRVVRLKQVRHILDADRIRAHLLELHGELHEVVLVVHGALGVADRSLNLAAVLLDILHRRFHVARVVQRVENTDDVDAVLDRPSCRTPRRRRRHNACSRGGSGPRRSIWQRRLRHRFFSACGDAPHGSSLRKRMQTSNVAPPQHSRDQYPMLSSISQAGSISSMRMRVAA